MPVDKSLIEKLRSEYKKAKESLNMPGTAYPLSRFASSAVGTKIYGEMQKDPHLFQMLTEYYPLPEIIALVQASKSKQGELPMTPAYWLYQHFYESCQQEAVAMQFLFGFASTSDIINCYPNAFAYSQQQIIRDLPLLDHDMICTLIKAYDDISKRKESDDLEIKKEKDYNDQAEESRKEIESLTAQIKQLEEEEKKLQASNTPNRNASPSIEDGNAQIDENAEDTGVAFINHEQQKKQQPTIEELVKQKKDQEKKCDEAKKRLKVIPKLRGDSERLGKALESKAQVYKKLQEMEKDDKARMGQMRDRLYTALSSYVPIERRIDHQERMPSRRKDMESKCADYCKHHVKYQTEDETGVIYDWFCDIVEYAKNNGAKQIYLHELHSFWDIPRNASEWESMVQNLNFPDKSNSGYMQALCLYYMNTEGENRKVLLDMVRDAFLTCSSAEDVTDFIVNLCGLEESANKKKNLIKYLLEEKERIRNDAVRKENRMAAAKTTAKVRDRFFSDVYQAVQGLEEYAWNQQTHDKGLFEAIATLRESICEDDINPVEDIDAWVNQEKIDFDKDKHHIDGTDIPQKVFIRTLGFKHTMEDGRVEVVPAWVYSAKDDAARATEDGKEIR